MQELTESMETRLDVVTDAPELEDQVRTTLEALTPVHVTTYLGVLIERRMRSSGKVTRQHR